MSPEGFLRYVLLIIAVIFAVVIGVWAIREITGSDPALILPFYEGLMQ